MRTEPATVEDLDDLVALWADLAAEMRAHGSRVRPAESREVVREQLGHAVVADRVRVAREDDAVVGFLSHRDAEGPLSTDGDRAVITYLYVAPERRGEGVGTALVEAAERDLRAAGHDEVALEVMADNEAARRFYRRLGFEPHRVELAKPLGDESDNHSNEDA